MRPWFETYTCQLVDEVDTHVPREVHAELVGATCTVNHTHLNHSKSQMAAMTADHLRAQVTDEEALKPEVSAALIR